MAGISPNAYGNAYQNFQGQQYQPQAVNLPMMPPQTFGGMNYGQANAGLSIAQVSSEEQVNSYPVAAGNTVLLIDFAKQTFYLKSTNVNGVPMPVQTADWKYRQNAVQGTPEQSSAVTREEFEELKRMLSQALGNRQNSRYNGNKRGGEQNVQPANDAAGNG